MAITQNTFTGNGSNLGPFSFTFKWLESTDIKVTVGGVLKTAGTHYNLQALNYTTKDGGQVLFTAGNAPANNAAIRIYRDTDDSALSATFFSGSAIRAQDLNDDFTQTLYSTQEVKARYLDRQSGEMESTYVPNTSTSVVTKGYMETNYGIIDEVGFTRWRQTASAAQTTFTGAGSYGGVLSYVPTKEQVYLNGALQQRDADYAASNGSSIVFNVALTAGDVVDVVCVNNLTASTVSNAANISYGGQFTGQSTRTVAAKLGDVVSVKDFGAVGDGVADDTAAIQAALDYAATQTLSVNDYIYTSSLAWPAKTAAVYFPPGVYLMGTVNVTTKAVLVGSGIESTFLRMKLGVTTPLISIPAVNVLIPNNTGDSNNTVIRDMTLLGNRTDTVTTSGADAISCPDAPFPIGTQYGSSVTLENIEIAYFSGNGITLGDNRNWSLMRNVISRYNNKSGLELASYDHRIDSCDFGVNGQHGIYHKAGGANSFVGCNIYYNNIHNVYIKDTYVPVWFNQCSIDYSISNCVQIEAGNIKNQYTFTACRLYQPGRNGPDNTYSIIYVDGGSQAFININDCWIKHDTFRPKYVIDAFAVQRIFVSGLHWDTTSLPWTTDFSVSYHNLQFDGTYKNGVGQRGGIDTVSLLANDIEVLRGTQAGRVLLGGTSSVNVNNTEAALQVSAFGGSTLLSRFSDDAFSPTLYLSKSRNDTNGLNTSVAFADYLGSIQFAGADGTDYNVGAAIQAQVSGTPGTSDMPTQLLFQTAGATGSPATRLAITQSGSLYYVPTTTPASPIAGEVYYDSGTNKLRCYDGTIWNDLF